MDFVFVLHRIFTDTYSGWFIGSKIWREMAIVAWNHANNTLQCFNTNDTSYGFVKRSNVFDCIVDENHATKIIYFKDANKAIILLVALLIVMGLAGGTTLPSLTVLIAAWVPEKERSKLGGFVLGGSQVRNLREKNNRIITFKSKLYRNTITDWQCYFVVCVWNNSISLAVANCILFLELYFSHLVYSFCKFVVIP